MKIYKISRLTSTEIEKKYNVQIVEPIMGKDLSSVEYFNLVLPEYNSTGKLLSPSELGCSLSHIAIYEEIVKNAKPAIILEEDINVENEDMDKAISFCEETSLDFVHLGWHPQVTNGIFFRGTEHGNGVYKIEPTHHFYGTYAYYLTPALAQELLKFQSSSIKRADSWVRFFMWSNKIPYFKPIFTHPPLRSDIHSERLDVSSKVYNVSFQNLVYFFYKLLKQKLAFLKLKNRNIKP